MSKVGITIFVNVWCNHVSPNFSLTILCKNLPSYFGPLRVFTRFAAEANLELLADTVLKLVSSWMKISCNAIIHHQH